MYNIWKRQIRIYLIWVIGFPVLTTVLSCTGNEATIQEETAIIQGLMNDVFDAHLEKDAIKFYRHNPDQWFDLRNGIVQTVEKSIATDRTQSYLDGMEFLEFEARQDPVIEVSDDGSMASYIGSVLVKGLLHKEPVFWVFSWQSVLKKKDQTWQVISTANTQAGEVALADVILENVRYKAGLLTDNSTIYALAHCSGPFRQFQDLDVFR